jgi:hypothetical protein
MPIESSYPKFEVPKVDIWSFLFDKKDRPYPDDKGWLLAIYQEDIISF